MSGRSNAGVAAERWRDVWRMHDHGTAQRAIGRRLGISLSSVQHFLAKGRPATDPLARPTTTRRSESAPAIRDVIVPGSVRVERSVSERTVQTARCGSCGHEQPVAYGGHTATCRGCGRTMRLDTAVRDAENVIPLRRTAP